MISIAINETIIICQKISRHLKEGRMRKQSQRIDKVALMLNSISSYSEDNIKAKLLSKHYKNEINYLVSSFSDIKGLKDSCPEQLSYKDWIENLSEAEKSVSHLLQLIND